MHCRFQQQLEEESREETWQSLCFWNKKSRTKSFFCKGLTLFFQTSIDFNEHISDNLINLSNKRSHITRKVIIGSAIQSQGFLYDSF